jgi:hypothetical protein
MEAQPASIQSRAKGKIARRGLGTGLMREVSAYHAVCSDPGEEVPTESEVSTGSARLLQFRVFLLGLFQDRKIGVGVFPEGKEILVGGAALLGIALEGIAAGQA